MSPVSVTARELIRVAEHLGFSLDRQKGSHAVYVRGRDRGVIPMHAGRTIKPKTLAGILDDMGITVEQLRRLLKGLVAHVQHGARNATGQGWV